MTPLNSWSSTWVVGGLQGTGWGAQHLSRQQLALWAVLIAFLYCAAEICLASQLGRGKRYSVDLLGTSEAGGCSERRPGLILLPHCGESGG